MPIDPNSLPRVEPIDPSSLATFEQKILRNLKIHTVGTGGTLSPGTRGSSFGHGSEAEISN